MKLAFYRTLWGNTEPLETYISSLKTKGYAGVETSLLFHSSAEFTLLQSLLSASDLGIVLLILTFGSTVTEHIESLSTQLEASVKCNPVKINVHGGCDYWSPDQSDEYFRAVVRLQETYPSVQILHETHRSRIFYNPWVTARVLKAFPSVYITADLSHWVVVCERHLNTPEFKDAMDLVYERTKHIHARPSTPQFIQLSFVKDPVFKEDLDAFTGYWKRILEVQRGLGNTEMTVDPEFGPAPYSLVQGFSGGKMVRGLDDCSDEVMQIVKELL
ncbi:hypothetical protein BCR33DRAFT_724721 [Rhizoclosmatium globosum]|uniref:Xylose isomerase-like TIM barrel domain-containing protein n=1 Tax=Rhizoclosmatium globosum TaxID=329046 RepID=A0A1Y2B4R7_9FUNG|nr:hypothetical protein BCR33DRAFT_724721 [Rhizoclosmatium globosum]|eukprot:ORY29477.1 hypothetical protein BCR33DRAFT_724721 [Rhizoclosmatium globosum]